MIFIPSDNWKALFFIKACYPEFVFNCHVLAFFKTSDFKEVIFFSTIIKYYANTKVPNFTEIFFYKLYKTSGSMFFLTWIHVFSNRLVQKKKIAEQLLCLCILESLIIPPPPSIVNFSIFFHPGHLYSNPPIIDFQSFLLTFVSVHSNFHHSPS